MKSCGSCTQCCKLLGVEELQKPQGTWCNLVQIGKGCGDYQNRPASCKAFECLWLQIPEMPEDMRPDKLKAVFGGTKDGSRSVVYLDPATPDHWQKNRQLHSFIRNMQKKFDVIIVSGDRRKLLLTGEQNG